MNDLKYTKANKAVIDVKRTIYRNYHSRHPSESSGKKLLIKPHE